MLKRCFIERFLPNINSTNRTIKSQAERVAINSPIQGTAADIIKKAMIDIFTEMKTQGLQSKMILQVHDELIFDVVESELEQMKKIVQENGKCRQTEGSTDCRYGDWC